jgi:hypothetical protein
MQLTAQHARLAARVYAVCVVLFGLAPVGIVLFLTAIFGLHPADWKLFVFGLLPGLMFVALGPFIWRQKTWAMIAALLLAVAFRYVLGHQNLAIDTALVLAPILFAGFTVIALMAGGKSV